VPDQVGDAVRHGDGREQGGEFDEVPAPVVHRATVPGTRHIRQVWSHAATVDERCCVITNGL
jgi:hypothetical protein